MRTNRAGQYRHKVIVETPTQGVDAVGAPTWSWATYVTRWCSITPKSGIEFYAADQEQSETIFEFRTRWDSTLNGITPKYRLKVSNYDSPETFRYFDILSKVDTYEKFRESLIRARESNSAAQTT